LHRYISLNDFGGRHRCVGSALVTAVPGTLGQTGNFWELFCTPGAEASGSSLRWRFRFGSSVEISVWFVGGGLFLGAGLSARRMCSPAEIPSFGAGPFFPGRTRGPAPARGRGRGVFINTVSSRPSSFLPHLCTHCKRFSVLPPTRAIKDHL
jgi:hypothetical protein